MIRVLGFCILALLLLLPNAPAQADLPPLPPSFRFDDLRVFPQDTPLLLSVFPHRLLETSKDALHWLDRVLPPRQRRYPAPAAPSPSWSGRVKLLWERFAKEKERLLFLSLLGQIEPTQPLLIAPFVTEAGQLRHVETVGLLRASKEAIQTPVFSGFAHTGLIPLKDVSEALITLTEILKGRNFLPEPTLQTALQTRLRLVAPGVQAWRLGRMLVILLPEARSLRIVFTAPSLHTSAISGEKAWLVYAGKFVERLLSQGSKPWRKTPALLSFLRPDRLLGLYLHPTALQKHGVLFGLLESYKALPMASEIYKQRLLEAYFQIAVSPMLVLATAFAEFEDLSLSLVTSPVFRLDSIASLTEAGRLRYTAATSLQERLPPPDSSALASLVWRLDLPTLFRAPTQAPLYPWLTSFFAGVPADQIPSLVWKRYSDGGIFMHLVLLTQGYGSFADAILSLLSKEQRASLLQPLPRHLAVALFPAAKDALLPTAHARVLVDPKDVPAFQKELAKAPAFLPRTLRLSSPQMHPFGNKTCLTFSIPPSSSPSDCKPDATLFPDPWYLRGHVLIDGLASLAMDFLGASHRQMAASERPVIYNFLQGLRTEYTAFHFGSRLTPRAQIFTLVGHSAKFSPPPLEEAHPWPDLSPILSFPKDAAFHKRLACLSDAQVALYRLPDVFERALPDNKAATLAYLRLLATKFRESLRCLERDPSTSQQRAALLQAWSSFFPPDPATPAPTPETPSSRPTSIPAAPAPSSRETRKTP